MGELPLNQVICGDCLYIMQSFPSNSIDLVVTDPPYGLSFMSKDWDKALPSKEAFEQIIRVLKPGALAFVMSSPRQDLMWRMCALLEGVGFELRQSFISWVYKTGFPKAYDVSKGIDQKLGVLKYRKIIGIREYADHTGNNDNFSEGINPNKRIITEPISDEAKRWEGWKSITGLKPALEPILMVNKPMSEKTIVDNVLQWGMGAINVNACKIPFQNHEDQKETETKNRHLDFDSGARENRVYGKDERLRSEQGNYDSSKGRFPSNLLVSDDALNNGKSQSRGHRPSSRGASTYGGGLKGQSEVEEEWLNDLGSASRYFDLDAWAEHHGVLDVPKPGSSERDYGLKGVKGTPKSKFNLNDGSKEERFDGAKVVPRRNTHPTVKPIKLMAYLIELGCPRNGVVLDPFAGSGTTCIAAKQIGRRYIGIELKKEYYLLAEARIAAYPQPLEWFTEVMEQ